MLIHNLQNLILVVVLAPLLGAIVSGFYRRELGERGAHWVTITGVAISTIAALDICKLLFIDGVSTLNWNAYTWAGVGNYTFHVGFLVDHLSAGMMLVVDIVSLLVHIYSIGYMDKDPGYQRFFSHISLFTFAMLMLVSANNFLQLFFGWEGVGLVSYLLIGFWFSKESAAAGGLKAFLVNRFGDFGMILGIGAVLAYAGSLDYATVFQSLPALDKQMITIFPGHVWHLPTVICILLFIGAMGKSAQVPLHIWLPESMEGPTPISALIHAATMVTAGIYMVSRLSPLYETSPAALSVVLVIGATGALFMGLLGVTQNDIKRVVAYSTLSQLGYMITALGASAFAAGIFHLMTHAFFKALLFLAAGSVIIGMHHEQDMRKMGNLKKYMPLTYLCFLIGNLSLAGIPPFSGFFSKDAIIEAVGISAIPGAKYAYFCVVAGVFVTALYSFRSLFMTFHGKERMDEHTRDTLKESPWVVTVPLILLAIPSIVMGWLMIEPALFARPSLFADAIHVALQYDVVGELRSEFHGAGAMVLHAIHTLPFWLALAGTATAWICYCWKTELPTVISVRLGLLYKLLLHKYGFDELNDLIIVRGGRGLGQLLYKFADLFVIDGMLVNGTGRSVRYAASKFRLTQSGYLYHYVLVMVVGLLAFLCWLLLG